ncbi:hypothetical protein NDU88_003901 [Pleurodeles waltl]|uniref:Uncharacterized protein n=1 Tax=Pleurodeles waltl TaxID=8319 RepID=A0AAV7UE49_PLEWA|nr:hypothetical protein NDU88_003901 [Pleurodeles waltl]
MPGGRTSGKRSGKPTRKLLFSEALQHSRVPSSAPEVHPTTPPSNMVDQTQGATMDRILQEISAVGCRLERMDNVMTSLTAETKSMHLDIAGFESQVTGLEQRVRTVETHLNPSQDRDQELIYLCSMLIDLEDRSRRDNVPFFRFPEYIEGVDIHSYLRETLPKLTGLTFDPPGISKSAQARPQVTGLSQPAPPNHSMPPVTRADPPIPTGGLCTWSIQDGWTRDQTCC